MHTKAIEAWHAWLALHRDDIDTDRRSVLSHKIWYPVIWIFRDLFFFGHSPPIVLVIREGLVARHGAYGRCTLRSKMGDALIEIDPFAVHPHPSGSRTASLIGTLRHELVHAYLEFYACDGQGARGPSTTKPSSSSCSAKRHLPLDCVDHGLAWQVLAAAHVREYGVAPFENEVQMQLCFPGNWPEALALRQRIIDEATRGFGGLRTAA
ncbi:hypothetical protein LTR36_006067 [Oleoguttula mirabilis]|uniref:SprT-like domain-containing protein n=1 Tax=Oleoguttula mirabilis TaxID=1507867 RepID=A0AAV9JCQ3_9PEZI|nr:hypothetical protein LTR36_006067 [Oleoguttula mirabilis]